MPAPRRKAPIEAALPKQTVLVSHGTNCIVSKIAMPAETEPPGELMYIVMSEFASSFARYSSCASKHVADLVTVLEPRRRMRSRRRRERTSTLSSPVPTIGSAIGGTLGPCRDGPGPCGSGSISGSSSGAM